MKRAVRTARWLAPLRQRWATRRFRLAALLGALVAALLVVLALGGSYVLEVEQTGAAGSLPPLAPLQSAMAPRFLFSINGVSRPLGVAVSPEGDRVYVTESDGQLETKIFDRDGKSLGALNPPGSAPASRAPVYVAVSPEGKVYVSDRRAATVHVYSPDGNYLGPVEPPGGAGSAWAPLALGFDAQGNLLVTDVPTGQHGVLLLSPDGALVRRYDPEAGGLGQLKYPNGVASDRQGRILVADSNNGRVLAFDSAGNTLWALAQWDRGAGIGLPRGLAVDNRDRAYVVDTVNQVVLVYELGERGARPLFTLGTEGINDGQFSFPNGIAVDRGGRLYITDRENNRVQVWTY